jgi:hypothetical protein
MAEDRRGLAAIPCRGFFFAFLGCERGAKGVLSCAMYFCFVCSSTLYRYQKPHSMEIRELYLEKSESRRRGNRISPSNKNNKGKKTSFLMFNLSIRREFEAHWIDTTTKVPRFKTDVLFLRRSGESL